MSGKPSSMMQVFYNHIKFHLFEQEKDIEDFITSLDSQDKSRSPPVGLERKLDESGKSESTVVFFFLLSTFTVSESTEHQELLHVQTAPCGDLPSAPCVSPSLSFVSGPLAWWPEWLSGSCVQGPCLEPGAAVGRSGKAQAATPPRALRFPERVRPAGLAAAAGLGVDGGPRAALNADSGPLPVRGSGCLQFWTWSRLPSPMRCFQRWSPSDQTSAPCPAAPSLSLPSASFTSCAPRARALSSRAGFGDGRSLGVRKHVHVCVEVS